MKSRAESAKIRDFEKKEIIKNGRYDWLVERKITGYMKSIKDKIFFGSFRCQPEEQKSEWLIANVIGKRSQLFRQQLAEENGEKIKQDLMPKYRRNVVFALQLEPGSAKYKKYCIYAENKI